MQPIDPRAWNLFGALALGLTACGQRTASLGSGGEDGETSTSGESSDWGDEAESFDTGDEDDDVDDGYHGYCLVDDDEMNRCSGYYGNYDEYDPPECEEHVECGPAELCVDFDCQEVAVQIPACGEPLSLVQIPLPAETDGALEIAAMDLDGDALTDLVARRDEDLITFRSVDDLVASLALGPLQGSAALVPASFDSAQPHGVAVVEQASGIVHMLSNDGQGALGTSADLGMLATAGGAVAADVNADGSLDLATGSSVVYGDGMGGLAGGASIPSFDQEGTIALAQFDQDPEAEFLGVIEAAPGWPAIWNPEQGTEDINPIYDTRGITAVLAADLAGVQIQYAWALSPIKQGYAFLARFGPLPAEDLLGAFALPAAHSAIAVADLQGDGLPELIGYGHDNSAVVIYSDMLTNGRCYTSLPVFPNDLAVGDFDGDGREDFVLLDGGKLVRYSAE